MKRKIFLIFFILLFLIPTHVGFDVSLFCKNQVFAEDAPPVGGANNPTTSGAQKQKYGDINNIDYAGNFQFLIAAPLMALLRLEGFLINLAVDIIAWTMTPSFLGILDNDGLYKGWSYVRDVLNIFFIFFLLFSAFSTIFQVSKYHIRSTWVMIVVMALLVNFSWPITRVMIDVSNLAMVQFIGGNGDSAEDITSHSLMANFGKESRFLELMLGADNIREGRDKEDSILAYVFGSKKGSITVGMESNFLVVLFFGIIIGFLFLVTFGAVALLLVIRVILLAVLLVFASVGFTLAAFPGTRSYSGQWWSALMKQLIVGPVLLFCLLVAIMVMKNLELEMPSEIKSGSIIASTTQTLLQFIVTIVLVWSGIILSSRVGAEGSGMAFGFANKAAAWGRKTLKRGSIGSAKFVGRQADSRLAKGRVAGTVSGLRQRASNIKSGFDKKYQSQIDEQKARVMEAGPGLGGDKNAMRNLENKRIAEMKKKWKDDNIDTEQLADKATKAKGAELQALVETISEKKDVSQEAIRKMASRVNEINDSGLIKAVNKKAAETGNAHVAYDERLKALNKNVTSAAAINQNRQNTTNEIYGGMDAKTYAKQRETIMRAAKENRFPGSEPEYAYVENDLRTKLNRASFARDMQNVDTNTYTDLSDINNTHL